MWLYNLLSSLMLHNYGRINNFIFIKINTTYNLHKLQHSTILSPYTHPQSTIFTSFGIVLSFLSNNGFCHVDLSDTKISYFLLIYHLFSFKIKSTT